MTRWVKRLVVVQPATRQFALRESMRDARLGRGGNPKSCRRFRWLVREVVTSDIYARGHAPDDAAFAVREELESNFLATPMRRMLSEAMYDSIVTAGHLFEVKHLAGQNTKVVMQTIRVPNPRPPPGCIVLATSCRSGLRHAVQLASSS